MAITNGYRVKLYGQSEGLVVCCLITIYYNGTAVITLSTDPTQRLTEPPIVYGTISRGVAYLFAPVEVILPLDEAESEPSGQLSISNVDRRLVTLVRSTTDGITALLEIIDPADPDNVQRSYGDLMVVGATYDANEIVFSMRVDILQDEPFPSGRFVPSAFPLIF